MYGAGSSRIAATARATSTDETGEVLPRPSAASARRRRAHSQPKIPRQLTPARRHELLRAEQTAAVRLAPTVHHSRSGRSPAWPYDRKPPKLTVARAEQKAG